MRNLVFMVFWLLLSTLFQSVAEAKICKYFDEAAKMLNPHKWVERAREFKKAGKGEPVVELANHEQAMSYVYRFPALSEFGFGTPSKLNWTKVVSRLEKSVLNGKVIGWERKLDNGSWARVRIDVDPTGRGGHYNIEMKVKSPINGQMETHKLAVNFACNGHPCNDQDILKLASQLNK